MLACIMANDRRTSMKEGSCQRCLGND